MTANTNYSKNTDTLDSRIDSFYKTYMENHPYARGLEHPPGGPAYQEEIKIEEDSLPPTDTTKKKEWKFSTPLPADEVESVHKFDPVRQVGRIPDTEEVNPRSAFVPEGSINPDMVNSPDHYTEGSMEAINVMEAKLTQEQYRGYLQGAVLKYLLRCNYKGKRIEDLSKAQWYLNKLVLNLSQEERQETLQG